MTTQIQDRKATKQAERLAKRRESLLKAMRKDVLKLQRIVRGRSGKK